MFNVESNDEINLIKITFEDLRFGLMLTIVFISCRVFLGYVVCC